MIHADMPLHAIFTLPEMAGLQDKMIAAAQSFFSQEDLRLTLRQYQTQKQPAWNSDDICFGLNRLCELRRKGHTVLRPVYTDTALQQVQLLHLPADTRTEKAVVVLLSGGAYGAVCTMAESLPVAAKLNALGFDCWCLNYRTATPQSFENGLLPLPLDDLAAALARIGNTPYVVAGFSAGGHLAALWGTRNTGARHYDLPQPAALLLGYPLITMANQHDGPMKQYMCTGMFGKGYTDADIAAYDAARQVDAAYPPVFLVRCKDDDTIPRRDGDMLLAALQKEKTRCDSVLGEHGGHGFGLGSATDTAGWVERAAVFIGECV